MTRYVYSFSAMQVGSTYAYIQFTFENPALHLIQLKRAHSVWGRASVKTAFDSAASELMRKFIENCMVHALRPQGARETFGGCIFRNASSRQPAVHAWRAN